MCIAGFDKISYQLYILCIVSLVYIIGVFNKKAFQLSPALEKMFCLCKVSHFQRITVLKNCMNSHFKKAMLEISRN